MKAHGFFPGEITVPKKKVPREIFDLLLSAAERGRSSDEDVFRLLSLMRASLEENSQALSRTKLGLLRRSSLYSAFSQLLSAADASVSSDSFKPLLSKKRLAFSCISKVKEKDARIFLERSFTDVFSISSSKPLRDPSFYVAADRLLGILPVSMARVRFGDILQIFVFAFLINLVLLFSLSGVPFDTTIKALVLMNLYSVYAGVSDIMRPGRAEDMPGVYARLDILISKGIEPRVLDAIMNDVSGHLKASKDPVGWARSVTSLLNEYKVKNPSKEAVAIVEKWVGVLGGYRKQG